MYFTASSINRFFSSNVGVVRLYQDNGLGSDEHCIAPRGDVVGVQRPSILMPNKIVLDCFPLEAKEADATEQEYSDYERREPPEVLAALA